MLLPVHVLKLRNINYVIHIWNNIYNHKHKSLFIYACHAISVLVAQYLRMTKMMRNVHIPLISLTKFFSFYFFQSKLYSRVGNFWDVQIIISNKVLFGIILSSFLEFGNITLIKGSSN